MLQRAIRFCHIQRTDDLFPSTRVGRETPSWVQTMVAGQSGWMGGWRVAHTAQVGAEAQGPAEQGLTFLT